MRAAALAFVVTVSLTTSATLAQQPLRVAVFKTAADDADLVEVATALDPVVASALSERSDVTIAARPALDLPSMQLAIDCVGETWDCLRAAATQAEADSLLAPSVRSDAGAVVVSLLFFDPNRTDPVRSVQRRYEGARPGEQALAGVNGMLVELFGATAAPDEAGAASPSVAATQPVPPPPAAKAKPESGGAPIAAIIVGGVGVALIGTGVAFGVMSNATEDAAHDIHPSNEDQAREASEKLATAGHQATVANVAFGLGAAALVGAGVLLFWHLKERRGSKEPAPQVALRPQLGWGSAGLTLTAAWNDSL